MSHNEYEYRSTTLHPMTTAEIVRATRVIQRRIGAGRYPRETEASLRAFMEAARWIAKNCLARLRCCNGPTEGLSDASALRAAMERKRLFSSAAKLTLLMMRIEVAQRKLAAGGRPSRNPRDHRASPRNVITPDGSRGRSASPIGPTAEAGRDAAHALASALAGGADGRKSSHDPMQREPNTSGRGHSAWLIGPSAPAARDTPRALPSTQCDGPSSLVRDGP
jgi:hypothetical protein